MKPPRWADRFLEWYCHPQLLEEIQGDAYELYYRTAGKSKRKADLLFVWNVIRFFRWKNIRRKNRTHYTTIFSAGMLRNILLVAFRNFFRQPEHALLNVLGLTVGFTCAFLILLWTCFEFSFDRFHPDADRIYRVVTHVASDKSVQTYNVAASRLDVSSIPEIDKTVSIATGERWPHVLCLRADSTRDCIYIKGVYSNQSLFSTLHFPTLKGDPDPLSKPNSIAISENTAQLLFGNEEALGKTLKIDGWQTVTVASVFQNIPVSSTIQFDFVMPFAILKKLWGINDDQFNENFFDTYIKTSKPVSAESLNEKLNDVRVVTEAYKAQNIRYQALPLLDWRLRGKFENGEQAGGRMEYVVLFIVIGSLVMIMAIINFINMTTARATTRSKEIGIRKVTGALRSGIVFQFVGESLMIVTFAFLLAVALTQFTLPYFNALVGEEITIDLFHGWIPVYLLIFLLLVSFLAGLYPAFVMSAFQPASVLKGPLSSSLHGSLRLRNLLLVIQLSVSTAIIIFSGVIYLQLNYVTDKKLGFDRENMIRVEPTAKLFRNFEAFKNELYKHPSIAGVASSNTNPLSTEGSNTGVSWPGKAKDQRVSFKTIAISYEFPETFGLRITEGRNFMAQPQDTLHTEALVTQDAVKIMGLKDPVGQIIKIGGAECVIIGVVNDFHTESLHASRLPVILYRTDYMHTSAIYVKYTAGTTQQSLQALSEVYKQFEPDFTMKYWFQDDTFEDIYKTEIIASKLILSFTLVAAVIAIIGIVGLATYNTLRRTKEIGIRRVFGASIPQVMARLAREFTGIILVATLIAFPLAWQAADQWLSGFAYRIHTPWWIFMATFVGITVTTLLIIFMQGIKTVVTNPTKTLRHD